MEESSFTGWQPSEREWCWIASVSEGVVWVLLDKRERNKQKGNAGWPTKVVVSFCSTDVISDCFISFFRKKQESAVKLWKCALTKKRAFKIVYMGEAIFLHLKIFTNLWGCCLIPRHSSCVSLSYFSSQVLSNLWFLVPLHLVQASVVTFACLSILNANSRRFVCVYLDYECA